MESPAWDIPLNFSCTADEYNIEEELADDGGAYPLSENYSCNNDNGDYNDTIELERSPIEEFDYDESPAVVKLLLDNSSNKQKWNESTRSEWILDAIYIDKDMEQCECGHDIKECCRVLNVKTGISFVLGNCCVNYIGYDLDNVFAAVKDGRLNKALIRYAWKMNFINEWERDFSLDLWRRRKFYGKQAAKLDEIKEKIFKRVAN